MVRMKLSPESYAREKRHTVEVWIERLKDMYPAFSGLDELTQGRIAQATLPAAVGAVDLCGWTPSETKARLMEAPPTARAFLLSTLEEVEGR